VSAALGDVELRESVIVLSQLGRSRESQQVEGSEELGTRTDGQEGCRRPLGAVRRDVRHDERTRADTLLTRHLLANSDLQQSEQDKGRQK
jgi:hypothetical protein